MPKVNVDKGLLERAKKCADEAGYSSAEEFVAHALERAIKEIEEPEDSEALEKRLQGLGYIE